MKVTVNDQATRTELAVTFEKPRESDWERSMIENHDPQ
jgi:hypothetical protein